MKTAVKALNPLHLLVISDRKTFFVLSAEIRLENVSGPSDSLSEPVFRLFALLLFPPLASAFTEAVVQLF